MHADDLRQAVKGDRSHEAQRVAVRLRRRGDEGGLEGDDAACRERLRCAAIGLLVGAEEVDAGRAVDVGVHEARHRGAVRPGGADTHRRHGTVLHAHVSLDQRSVDERRPHTKPHEASSLVV